MAGIGQRWGTGSGVVLGAGQVLTNAHNVRGRQVTVTFADGRTAEGNVAGHDIDGDLAVIETDTGQAPALPWATAAPAIGMPVFALANPGGRGLRVTFGFVSGIDRTFRGLRGLRITGSLEHTAPLLPGSSGGPVLDAAGQLLGITRTASVRVSPRRTRRRGAAPPGRHARPRESIRPPQLSITITPGRVASRLRHAVGLPDVEGLLIREIAEDSPAARADLAPGDLIVAVASQPVRAIDDLSGALRAADDTIELNVLRGTDERSIQVAFGQNSQPEQEA